LLSLRNTVDEGFTAGLCYLSGNPAFNHGKHDFLLCPIGLIS